MKPMITVSPFFRVQSAALAVPYSVGSVIRPSRLLLQAWASARWNSGSETMSLANSCWLMSYHLTRSSFFRVLLAWMIALLAVSLHQPMPFWPSQLLLGSGIWLQA